MFAYSIPAYMNKLYKVLAILPESYSCYTSTSYYDSTLNTY